MPKVYVLPARSADEFVDDVLVMVSDLELELSMARAWQNQLKPLLSSSLSWKDPVFEFCSDKSMSVYDSIILATLMGGAKLTHVPVYKGERYKDWSGYCVSEIQDVLNILDGALVFDNDFSGVNRYNISSCIFEHARVRVNLYSGSISFRIYDASERRCWTMLPPLDM
jgi:hypothetical protein